MPDLFAQRLRQEKRLPCRRQGRSVIELFDQAIKAMVNSAVQAPSLMPQVYP
jgi:hypothetical protein